MKKIFSLICFIALGFYLTALPVRAQSSSNTVLLLMTDNPQTVVGNLASYDLVLNTLGNDVNEVDVQFIIQGQFNINSASYNVLPQNGLQPERSSKLFVVREDQSSGGENGLRVHVVLRKSGDRPFNAGSGAIPVYKVQFRVTGPGPIRGYIDQTHSYVRYTDPNQLNYDNYTPETNPKILNVIGDGPTASSTSAPSPSPSPSSSPIASPEPSATPTTKYDQEFQRISAEVEQVKQQQQHQEERLSLLEQIIHRLQSFFGGLFK